MGKGNWKEKVNPKTLELITYLDSLREKQGQDVDLTLAKYFYHPDYLVKSKAFAMAALLAPPALVPALAKFLQEEQEEEFRLRAMEVLQKIGSMEALIELEKLLSDLNPLIVRGAIVAMGGIKDTLAAKTILEFASSPKGRIVRPEVVQEAVSFALEDVSDSEETLARLARKDGNIRRYLRILDLRKPAIPHFTVYPSADYFSLQVKKRGVNYKLYKELIG